MTIQRASVEFTVPKNDFGKLKKIEANMIGKLAADTHMANRRWYTAWPHISRNWQQQIPGRGINWEPTTKAEATHVRLSVWCETIEREEAWRYDL